MRRLRTTLLAAGTLALAPFTLPAQAGRISCKDGSLPKVGHFSCWGHGGVVAGAPTPAARPTKAKSAGKSVRQQGSETRAKTKPSGKKPTARATKAGNKAHARKAVKPGAK